MGAKVTATASPDKADFVRSMGADRVIDHRQHNALQTGEIYDVIVDTADISGFVEARKALAPSGRFLPLVMGLSDAVLNVATALFGSRRILARVVTVRRDDLTRLAQWVASGAAQVPIGARFTLDDIVEAHRLVDSHTKRGAALVLIGNDTAPLNA